MREECRIATPRPVISTEVEKSPGAALLVVSGKKGTCRTARLLPAGRVILNAVKNGRSANYKEGPFMCRLRANFGRLAHPLQNARRTSSK